MSDRTTPRVPRRWAEIHPAPGASGDTWLMWVHDDVVDVSTAAEVTCWRDVKALARQWGVPMDAVRCRRRTRQLLRDRNGSAAQAQAC